MVDVLEWIGTALSLLGAFLLATNSKVSKVGWWAFLAANVVMITFAWSIHRHGLLLQNVGFMFTSLLGIYRSTTSRHWNTSQNG